jgi:hypothetical protein
LRIWNGDNFEGPEAGEPHLEYDLPRVLSVE